MPVVPSEALNEGVLIAWNGLVQDLLIFEVRRSPYTGSPLSENALLRGSSANKGPDPLINHSGLLPLDAGT